MKRNTLYFCTYFDSHYLTKGLALYRSLVRHARPFRLWVLCFDDSTYSILQRLAFPEVIPVSLTDFEKDDTELLKAKNNRSRIEYYFTCTPSLPLYIFNHYPEINLITYLDADTFFFLDPTVFYEELKDGSVLIIGHRFPPHLRHLEQYGIYNVSWLSFKRDERAFSCLSWWRKRCIEWCLACCEDNRFADQKYLDNWPSLFEGIVVLQHKGANLAPWNLDNYKIRIKKSGVFVDEQPLIFFHFHGLEQIKTWVYKPQMKRYKVSLSPAILKGIYTPYIHTLSDIIQEFPSLLPRVPQQSNIRDRLINFFIHEHTNLTPCVLKGLRKLFRTSRNILNREYILVVARHIIV